MQVRGDGDGEGRLHVEMHRSRPSREALVAAGRTGMVLSLTMPSHKTTLRTTVCRALTKERFRLTISLDLLSGTRCGPFCSSLNLPVSKATSTIGGSTA